jgi:hypothetical protein
MTKAIISLQLLHIRMIVITAQQYAMHKECRVVLVKQRKGALLRVTAAWCAPQLENNGAINCCSAALVMQISCVKIWPRSGFSRMANLPFQ